MQKLLNYAFIHSAWSLILTVIVCICIMLGDELDDKLVPVYLSVFMLVCWLYLLIFAKANAIISYGWILTCIGLILDVFLINFSNFRIGVIGWPLIFAILSCVVAIKSQTRGEKTAIRTQILLGLLYSYIFLIVFLSICCRPIGQTTRYVYYEDSSFQILEEDQRQK